MERSESQFPLRYLNEQVAASSGLEVRDSVQREGVQVQGARVDADHARQQPREVLHVSGTTNELD